MIARPNRRLAAIVAADVAGYSRLVGLDEEGTIRVLQQHRAELIDPLIADFGGRIANTAGDSLLIEFPSAVEAVRFAMTLQSEMSDRNDQQTVDRRIEFRVGINVGDVIAEGDDLLGDGVNVAARLEGLAAPGGVCLSRSVHDQIIDKLDVALIDLGAIEVKNIARPIEVFRVRIGDEPIEARATPRKPRGRLLTAAGTVVLVAGLVISLWHPWRAPVQTASVASMAFPLPDRPSIVVLPFSTLSDESGPNQFADGITEDLITDLSKLSGLFVIARNTSFALKGADLTVVNAAERLGVRYILEGSVRRSGDTLRVNAELIDATTGQQLWADRFDGAVTDIFEAQDAFTLKVIEALKIEISASEKSQIAKVETRTLEAREAFQTGWALYSQFNREDNARSVTFLERAVEIDSDYGRAWGALALVHLRAAIFFDWDIPMGQQDALLFYQDVPHYLRRAEELGSPLAHVVRAMQHLNYRDRSTPEGKNRGTDDARIAAAAAIAAQPNDPEAHITMAWALIAAGKAEEGLSFVQAAMRLNPTYPSHYDLFLAAAHFSLGDLDRTAAVLKNGLKGNPKALELMPMLASVQAQLGQRGDARSTLVKWSVENGGSSLDAQVSRYFYPIRWVDRDRNDQLKDGLYLAALPEDVTVASLVGRLPGETDAQKVLTLRMLGWFGALSAPAVDTLIGALDAPSKSVQREAAITLGKIGPAASAAGPKLSSLLGQPIVGYHANAALHSISGN